MMPSAFSAIVWNAGRRIVELADPKIEINVVVGIEAPRAGSRGVVVQSDA